MGPGIIRVLLWVLTIIVGIYNRSSTITISVALAVNLCPCQALEFDIKQQLLNKGPMTAPNSVWKMITFYT
jgi:hypothetical protein